MKNPSNIQGKSYSSTSRVNSAQKFHKIYTLHYIWFGKIYTSVHYIIWFGSITLYNERKIEDEKLESS
jgi:hypothetical protein